MRRARLRPGGAANPEARRPLRYQVPSIPPSGGLPTTALSDRQPQYRDLEPRTTHRRVHRARRRAAHAARGRRARRSGTTSTRSNPASATFHRRSKTPTSAIASSPGCGCEASAALPAQLKWIGINASAVTQRAHVANEVLPDGTGEPDQTVVLSRRPVVPRSVRLRVTANGVAREWREIDDLMTAGPEVPVPDPKQPPGNAGAEARSRRGLRRQPRVGRDPLRRRIARRAPAARRHPARRLRLRRRPRRQRRAGRDQHRPGAARRHQGDQPGSHLGRRRRRDRGGRREADRAAPAASRSARHRRRLRGHHAAHARRRDRPRRGHCRRTTPSWRRTSRAMRPAP